MCKRPNLKSTASKRALCPGAGNRSLCSVAPPCWPSLAHKGNSRRNSAPPGARTLCQSPYMPLAPFVLAPSVTGSITNLPSRKKIVQFSARNRVPACIHHGRLHIVFTAKSRRQEAFSIARLKFGSFRLSLWIAMIAGASRIIAATRSRHTAFLHDRSVRFLQACCTCLRNLVQALVAKPLLTGVARSPAFRKAQLSCLQGLTHPFRAKTGGVLASSS